MKTKPFNLQEAKAGAKLVTRDGRPARLICDDAKGECPVIVLVSYDDEKIEIVRTVTSEGNYCANSKSEHDFDILIVNEPWRAKYNQTYYYIGSDGNVHGALDTRSRISNKHYDLGNYFDTRKEAGEASEKIKKLFEKMPHTPK